MSHWYQIKEESRGINVRVHNYNDHIHNLVNSRKFYLKINI